jgi:predicted Fe-Mo cluster-binding NifX family protein
MKVCFPVASFLSLESEVYGHFGSAPSFVVVDTETKTVNVINNTDQHHQHGMCNPVAALGGQNVDAVVVGGIGGGALMKLNSLGINVYKAMARTVGENLQLFGNSGLPQFHPGHVCSGHAGGGGCSH